MSFFISIVVAIQALVAPVANGPADWPAIVPAQVTTCSGTVSGVVYHDLDRNGTCDAGEPGVPAVVEFRRVDGEGGKTVFSDAQTGEYSGNVVCTDYTIRAYNTEIWLLSQTITKTVTADGFVLPIAVNLPTSFTASGTVYIDIDGDGSYRSNGRDETVSGAVVVLSGNNITGTLTTIANNDGAYNFRQLPAGNYRVIANTPTQRGEESFPLGVGIFGRKDIAVVEVSREYLPLVTKK